MAGRDAEEEVWWHDSEEEVLAVKGKFSVPVLMLARASCMIFLCLAADLISVYRMLQGHERAYFDSAEWAMKVS